MNEGADSSLLFNNNSLWFGKKELGLLKVFVKGKTRNLLKLVTEDNVVAS
jgi:hypothetical protein